MNLGKQIKNAPIFFAKGQYLSMYPWAFNSIIQYLWKLRGEYY